MPSSVCGEGSQSSPGISGGRGPQKPLDSAIGYLLGESFTLDERMGDELDKLYIDSRYPGDLGLLPQADPG